MMISLVFGLAYAGENVESHIDQARHFAKKKWYADAADELDLALAAPGGASSFEAHWLASEVAYAMLDVERAWEMAARAAEIAPDAARAEQAMALAVAYAERFGILTVSAPYDGMASPLQIEFQGMQFDPELKQFSGEIATALRDRTDLPVRVGLPAGTWLVNGHPVDVPAGGDAALQLPMDAVGRKGMAALQVTRIEAAAGMTTSFGARSGDLYPAPLAEVGVTQPLGGLLLGAVADVWSQSFAADETTVVHGELGWGAGLRAGTELYLGGSLLVRPSLAVRWAVQPGISDEVSGIATHVTSTGALIGGELSVDHRPAGRTTAFGTGIRLAVDEAIATQTTSFRMLADFSIAL